MSAVKRLPAGEAVSYGHRYRLEQDAWVATVPVGYADGYPRQLTNRGDVLIRGRRHGVAGTVTMDQLLVDCGDAEIQVGDEVVLLGSQGNETIGAEALGRPIRNDRVRDREQDRRAGAETIRMSKRMAGTPPVAVGAAAAAGAVAAGSRVARSGNIAGRPASTARGSCRRTTSVRSPRSTGPGWRCARRVRPTARSSCSPTGSAST